MNKEQKILTDDQRVTEHRFRAIQFQLTLIEKRLWVLEKGVLNKNREDGLEEAPQQVYLQTQLPKEKIK